jgi:hypothetical protein
LCWLTLISANQDDVLVHGQSSCILAMFCHFRMDLQRLLGSVNARLYFGNSYGMRRLIVGR